MVSLQDAVAAVYPDRTFESGGRDPHIWLSPKRAVVMIETIAQEMCALDPEHSDVYNENAAFYIQQLEELDQQIEDILEPVTNRKFIVYHPAFGYFADDYGLTMYALEEAGKEATVSRLEEMIDLAKEEQIKVIFYQAEIDSSQSQAFAEEIGGETMQLSPLSPDYIDNLKGMAQQIAGGDAVKDTAVHIENLSVYYGRTPAIEQINLDVRDGEYLGIIGPNGGGKSTLLKAILGLVPSTTGRVRIFGEQPDRNRLKIGYVPQFSSVDKKFPIKLMDVVLTGRLKAGLTPFFRYSPADRKAVSRLLEQVGIAELADRQISELSGGQFQKMLIARALAVGPRLLLLDEPTASVDVNAQSQIYGLLERTQQTHDHYYGDP